MEKYTEEVPEKFQGWSRYQYALLLLAVILVIWSGELFNYSLDLSRSVVIPIAAIVFIGGGLYLLTEPRYTRNGDAFRRSMTSAITRYDPAYKKMRRQHTGQHSAPEQLEKRDE